MSTSLDEYWSELVTAALLGTDRREPPPAPSGPVADLVADAVRPDGASRMLAAVCAVAAARRAGFVALAPAPPLQGSEPDERPLCTARAVATWRTVAQEWSVLEDEWMLTCIERGLRVPPDALVEMLIRHRADVVRRARVTLAGGSLARWLVDHLPELAVRSKQTASAAAVANLPDLPTTPELAELLLSDAHTVSRRLAEGFDDGEFGPAHRAVLVNFVARCRAAVLVDLAEALDQTRVGQALALADMARLRHQMLTELT